MNNKATLWTILEKYENTTNMSSFCNSISKIIQEDYQNNDIINIYQGLNRIDSIDINNINLIIGNKIDQLLFTI
jgi:hypothetical protein